MEKSSTAAEEGLEEGTGGGFRLRRLCDLLFIEFPYTCAAHPHRVRLSALLIAIHALLWCTESFLYADGAQPQNMDKTQNVSLFNPCV